jgi:hypothetical protein
VSHHALQQWIYGLDKALANFFAALAKRSVGRKKVYRAIDLTVLCRAFTVSNPAGKAERALA